MQDYQVTVCSEEYSSRELRCLTCIWNEFVQQWKILFVSKNKSFIEITNIINAVFKQKTAPPCDISRWGLLIDCIEGDWTFGIKLKHVDETTQLHSALWQRNNHNVVKSSNSQFCIKTWPSKQNLSVKEALKGEEMLIQL